MKSFLFELLTPEGAILRNQVEEVLAPGQEGYFGVRAGHAHFATNLKKGSLTVKWDGHSRCYAVTGGLIQVTPEKVVVCAESAVLQEVGHT